MIKISFTQSFIRQLDKLEAGLKVETIEKIILFKNRANHKTLRAHKLKGPLQGRWSFSVNFKTRIVFGLIDKNHALFHAIGDHKVYD